MVKKIFFRVEASYNIGSGHIMRCMMIAEKLQKAGAEVGFICRELSGNLISLLQGKGFKVFNILAEDWIEDAKQTGRILQNNKASWLIVDHYSLDIAWENKVKKYVKKIMVIEDGESNFHSCDVLVDFNIFANKEKAFKDFIPLNAIKLLGPEYIFLREEFCLAVKRRRVRGGTVKRVMITFGGSDPTQETEKVLEALQSLKKTDIKWDIIIGSENPRKKDILKINKPSNINIFSGTNQMAELMLQADLAIGAGGLSQWERCFLGLPAVLIITADNQLKQATALAAKGAVINLGYYYQVTTGLIVEIMQKLLVNEELVRGLAEESLEFGKKIGSSSKELLNLIMESK